MSQAPLLDRALRKATNGRALAHAIGWSEQQVSRWKHGKEQVPAEAIAAIAAYLGEDPLETLATERGGGWKRAADSWRNKISAGFEWVRLLADPRRSLFSAR